MRQTLNLNKWVFGIFAILLVSCQTIDFPEPDNQGADEPVFKFEGLVNGEPTAFAAGNENYFMETSTIRDMSGVHTFVGHLKEMDCTSNCPNSLKFIIRDAGASTTPNPINVNAVLGNGTLNFTNDNPADSVLFKFRPLEPNENFEQTLYYNNKKLEVSNETEINLGPIQDEMQLTLKGNHKEGYFNYTLTQPVFLNGVQNGLRVEIKTNEQKIILQIKTGSDKSEVFWNDNSKGITLELTERPDRPVEAEIVYDSGEQARFEISFSEDFRLGSIDVEKIDIGFEYLAELIKNNNVRQFKTVEVLYYNGQGLAFSSLNAEQDANSAFEINRSDEFQIDANGKRTRKIDFKLDMMAADSNGNLIDVSGQGVFALGYP